MYCAIPEPHQPTKTIPSVETTRYRPAATTLAQMTTIGVGGKVANVENVASREEFIDAIRSADEAQRELLVVGGGSNILASDADFSGVVVHDTRADIEILSEDFCGGARMRVAAGTPWDDVVVFAIEHGWMGLESLSGIPGTAGAAPVQNIGAYGADASGVIASVRTYDRKTAQQRTFFLSDLDFGYRHSVLKQSILDSEWGNSPRWIVLDVDFHLRLATLGEPIRYAQLAQHLGVEVGSRVPANDVRAAVLELRRSKGMVLDDADRDTYSLGSFFTNPVLNEKLAEQLPADAPRFAVANNAAINQIGAAAPKIPGQVKTSAAWLITHAGFDRGYGLPNAAALSTKHALALTNRGAAKAEDIANLAREIRDGVFQKFGVELVPEPVTVGIEI